MLILGRKASVCNCRARAEFWSIPLLEGQRDSDDELEDAAADDEGAWQGEARVPASYSHKPLIKNVCVSLQNHRTAHLESDRKAAAAVLNF
jgi:hypothetical protein